MKLTKIISEEVDLSEAEFEEDTHSVKAYIESDRTGREKLCKIDKDTGRIENISILKGYKLGPAEFAKRLKIIDKALGKAGFAGFIEDRELEDRIEELEQKIDS